MPHNTRPFESFLNPSGQFDHWNDGTHSEIEKSRRLFGWLCDDTQRAGLYRLLRDCTAPTLKFRSRAMPGEPPLEPEAYLVTQRDHVEAALKDPRLISNDPYQALGSGTFMLGLDGAAHAQQRAFVVDSAAMRALQPPPPALAELAFSAATVPLLAVAEFDLTVLAEQAALRYVSLWFGLGAADHVLLQTAMRASYAALTYQILGRHFVTAPTIIPSAAPATGKLLERIAEILDNPHADDLAEDDRERDAVLGDAGKGFVPLLRTMNAWTGSLTVTERAIVAIGMMAGIVGNVQAAVSTSINEFFRSGVDVAATQAAAAGDAPLLGRYVMEALRLNPPAAFLPRRTLAPWNGIPANANVILAIGAATRDQPTEPCPDKFDIDAHLPDPLVFGGTVAKGHIHQCLGESVAKPAIVQFVRRVLLLPGLAQRLDAQTGAPIGLSKTWGFRCAAYPMRYALGRTLVQQPLNVIMKVKQPVAEHAERLKLVIQYGAPRIESRLKTANHVHFAWFQFIESDTKLVLHTIYDGDFDAYIEYFALQIGSLFDDLFEHIEDAPPMPVTQHPKEFVETIRRFNVAPVGHYFFSAYRDLPVAKILANRAAKPAA